ncbi:MAG: RNA polymerase sigma factor, partial [Oceanipulchritudo sp.]
MKLPPDFTSEERLAAQWLHRMGKGDIPALDALYGLYHRPLLHLFSVILKDDFAAEEVLQDTFVRVYRAA